MKVLLATLLAAFLFLQMAWGKRLASLQIHDRLARASKVVSAITQAADYKMSRVDRQAFDLTCDQNTLENFGSRYPMECAARIENLDISGLQEGDFTALAGFVNSFCDATCGQPLVDLFYDCNLPEFAIVLVYACRENDDGDRCGEILQTTVSISTNVENDCLPRTVNCSTECQNTLINFQEMSGCCGDFTEILNVFGLEDLSEINNATLFDSCGLSVTELCTRGALRGAGKAFAVTKVTFVGLTMLALVVLLLL